MLAYNTWGRSLKYRPRLKISECFHSIQGEGIHTGLPCTFIRLTGCALRCGYCDSEYAFYGGQWQSFDELLDYARKHGSRLVQVTGGEPLHQKAVWPFCDLLIENGFKPLIETSGAEDISGLNPQAHIVLDIKTPASGEADKMRLENLDLIRESDEVKFVVCHRDDLAWSLDFIRSRDLDRKTQVLISPEWGAFDDRVYFAETVANSGLNVRFQLQIHKILWGDVPGK